MSTWKIVQKAWNSSRLEGQRPHKSAQKASRLPRELPQEPLHDGLEDALQALTLESQQVEVVVVPPS